MVGAKKDFSVKFLSGKSKKELPSGPGRVTKEDRTATGGRRAEKGLESVVQLIAKGRWELIGPPLQASFGKVDGLWIAGPNDRAHPGAPIERYGLKAHGRRLSGKEP